MKRYVRNALWLVGFTALAGLGLTRVSRQQDTTVGLAPTIVQARGRDAQVRYQDLATFAPWDDRNYTMTRADVALLAPNEAEQYDPIPAYFRAQLRRANPTLRRTGPAQYPRSALQIFLLREGGFQLEGQRFQSVERVQGRFRFLSDSAVAAARTAPAATRVIFGEVRVTTPAGAAESAIKTSPADPNRVIAGSNGPGTGQRMHFSTDGGTTWTQTTLPLGSTCCDPTVDWSSDGLLAYAATLGNCGASLCGVWFYRSSDNGQTWTDLQTVTPGDPRRELTNSGSDKEYLHVDKVAASPCRDNVYLTWHNNNDLQFARSTNNGNTWATTSFAADPAGIGSDIATDAAGRIYYVWPSFDTQEILLKRSTDCGATFGAGTITIANTNADFDFPIPSIETRRAWIYASVDADLSTGPYAGSIYVAWTDTDAADNETSAASNHARIQVAYSRDQGATWTVVTPHSTTDIATVDRWNQWLAVGPNGDVYVAYYDTRNSTGRTGVDLYYSYSTNGAQTFSAPSRLTSVTSTNLTDAFEFGDYNGLDHLTGDRFVAVFTDNRAEGGETGNSEDVYAVSAQRPRSTNCCAAAGATAMVTIFPLFGAVWWRRRARPKK